MNRLILIALLVLVTGSCIESQRPGGPGVHGTSGGNGTSSSNNTSGGAGHPGALGGPGGPSGLGGPGGHGGPGGPSQSACSRALAPSSTEFQQLPTAVETCVAEQSGLQAIIDGLRVPDFQPRQGGGGERGCKSHDVASLLEANDYTTEATTLRKCIARELSLLAVDGSFDMAALKAKILAKVTGLAVEANTQLGLDGCPEVVEYNVPEYLGCIRAYCETGAAP